MVTNNESRGLYNMIRDAAIMDYEERDHGEPQKLAVPSGFFHIAMEKGPFMDNIPIPSI